MSTISIIWCTTHGNVEAITIENKRWCCECYKNAKIIMDFFAADERKEEEAQNNRFERLDLEDDLA